jgi:hypothetical protein
VAANQPHRELYCRLIASYATSVTRPGVGVHVIARLFVHLADCNHDYRLTTAIQNAQKANSLLLR